MLIAMTATSTPIRSSCQITTSTVKPAVTKALLKRFLDLHRERRLVIVTCGTVATAPHVIQTIMEHLLREGNAVVSTVPLESAAEACRALFYFERFLPSTASARSRGWFTTAVAEPIITRSSMECQRLR